MEGGDVQVLHDPELVAKVTDIIGLYLAAPDNAVVSVLRRGEPDPGVGPDQEMLPMQPGPAGQRTYDYVRHGTAPPCSALEITAGRVTGVCKNRHRNQGFLAFLKHLARAYPDQELHLVMDSYAPTNDPR